MSSFLTEIYDKRKKFKVLGIRLSTIINGVHWVITDLRYGHTSERGINELKRLNTELEKTIYRIEELDKQ